MSNDPSTLILVRHGITAWNREMRMQGHSDVDLDAEGVCQAERLADRICTSVYSPSAIYSSDLKRAYDTAQVLGTRLALPVFQTAQLRETMLGDWEGLTAADIAERGESALLELYRADSYLHRPPGSESLEEVWDRMVRFVDGVRGAHPYGCVVIVGHGGSLRALLCSAMNAPVTSMKHIWLSNAGMSVIEEIGPPERRLRRVALLNDTSHLW